MSVGESSVRQPKRMRTWVKPGWSEQEEGAFAPLPPRSARPIGLQTSRAGLLSRLAREPAVSRSVGLVR
jgi:hypothetical protein